MRAIGWISMASVAFAATENVTSFVEVSDTVNATSNLMNYTISMLTTELINRNRTESSQNASESIFSPAFVSSTSSQTESSRKNSPVCKEIVNSKWWNKRKARKDPNKNKVEIMDRLCSLYSGQPKECKKVEEHDGVPIRCEVVGAHSEECRGNPCNFLNDGSCDIENTRGECIWFDKEWLRDFNAYWKPRQSEEPFKDLLTPQHGCFRNPCNMAGYDKKNAAEHCSRLSVPGLYSCTWCKIRGEGMGCQMEQARGIETDGKGPPAKCAWAMGAKSDEIYAIGQVENNAWKWLEDGKCQCDASFPFCSEAVKQSRGGFFSSLRNSNPIYRKWNPSFRPKGKN